MPQPLAVPLMQHLRFEELLKQPFGEHRILAAVSQRLNNASLASDARHQTHHGLDLG